MQSTAPPGGVAKESSLIAPETHPPPSASARFCATFWYEREDEVTLRPPPLCCILSPRGLKVATAGGEQEQKRAGGKGEGERKRIATWREQNAFSHNDFTPTPREREGGKGPQKDPHPLISPTLFAVWSFVLKTPSMLRFNYDVTKSHLNFPTTQRPMLSNMIMKGPFER